MSSCILFHFYIKPQPIFADVNETTVVSYSISTSNHNVICTFRMNIMLYLIPFLHQTTTAKRRKTEIFLLYLIPFLHQTTTPGPLL